MLYQDDPKKCTAAKMVRFGLARRVTRIRTNALVLDPFSERLLLPRDRHTSGTIVGIDCSWNHADETFSGTFWGIGRRLPPLLAGNPVNYARLNKLTTVEALSASLFILGFREQAMGLLDKFKWGHTFYELNQNLLGEYSGLDSEDEIDSVLRDYGLA